MEKVNCSFVEEVAWVACNLLSVVSQVTDKVVNPKHLLVCSGCLMNYFKA